MAKRHKQIVVVPGSDLDRALEEADDATVEIVRQGVHYQMIRAMVQTYSSIWDGYDPARAERAVKSAAGGWAGALDAEAFKVYISERRRTASRSTTSR